jgi:hypothetical protein
MQAESIFIKAMLRAKNVRSVIEQKLDTTNKVDMDHLVDTAYLVNKTKISKSEVHRIVKELNIWGLIDIYKTTSGKGHENQMILKSAFGDEFQKFLEKSYPMKEEQDEISSFVFRFPGDSPILRS